jgi:hypothetical protein
MKTFKEFLQEKFDSKLAYHDELNPKIWADDELKPKVKTALDKIAKEFIEFLKINKSDVVDIVMTGSNANFNYTSQSDVDIHIIVDFDKLCRTCNGVDIDDCMNAKKTLWNSQHSIEIYGFNVEVYVQHSNERAVSSAGVYSLKNNSWIKKPSIEKVNLSDKNIKLKAQVIMNDIDSAIDNKIDDVDSLKKIKERIKTMRSAGLEKGGEFSVENLAMKVIRNNGYIDKLNNYIKTLSDHDLSLY